jgi:exodeoxyribonuclease-3
VRLATWNVNSAKARQFRLIDWLDRAQPDIAFLQETKLGDADFDALFADDLFRRDYRYAHFGQGRWNGVALLSRIGLEDVAKGLGQQAGPLAAEARAVGATCGGLRVWSVYVPNGRTIDDPMYEAKLTWLGALAEEAVAAVQKGPFVVAGDFNIAPADVDVWDPAAFAGATHVTAPERAALDRLKELGLVDLVRVRWPAEVPVFSYWDYRAGAFHQDLGMRIDLLLGSAPLASRLKAAYTDRAARKGKDPSDHAPVIVDLDETPDGDIGPVVPPPSLKGSSSSRPRPTRPAPPDRRPAASG